MLWVVVNALGWVFVWAGVVLAAQGMAGPMVQGGAPVGVALVGLVTLWIQYYYRDKAEARTTRVKELEAGNAALVAKVVELTDRVRDLEDEASGPSAPLPIPEPDPDEPGES